MVPMAFPASSTTLYGCSSGAGCSSTQAHATTPNCSRGTRMCGAARFHAAGNSPSPPRTSRQSQPFLGVPSRCTHTQAVVLGSVSPRAGIMHRNLPTPIPSHAKYTLNSERSKEQMEWCFLTTRSRSPSPERRAMSQCQLPFEAQGAHQRFTNGYPNITVGQFASATAEPRHCPSLSRARAEPPHNSGTSIRNIASPGRSCNDAMGNTGSPPRLLKETVGNMALPRRSCTGAIGSTAPPPRSFDEAIGNDASPWRSCNETIGIVSPRRSCNEAVWGGNMTRLASKTSLLTHLGRDVTQMAANGELVPLVGRKKELEKMLQVLVRRHKNNPVLIGDPGVGKTAVVEGLAQKIVNGEVPTMLTDKRIVQIDVATLLAGTQNKGKLEARMETLASEVAASSNHVVLFIDGIHTIIGAGLSGRCRRMDVGAILRPVLARGDFQCICATTLEEYRAHFETEASLERRFQPIAVHPTDTDETVLILKGLVPKYESHHNVRYSEEALRACVKFAVEYMPDRVLPEKAIDVFDEVGAFVQLRHQDRTKTGSRNVADYSSRSIVELVTAHELALQRVRKEAIRTKDDNSRYEDLKFECQRMKSEIINCKAKIKDFENSTRQVQSQSTVVTKGDVARVISEITGTPLEKLSEDNSMLLLNLEVELNHRIFGQELRIAAVCKVLRRARVGLKNTRRPIASLLFCGPICVGKHELCKALSDVYFGQDNAMIRFDMSEFMEMHSVSKLIGSPANCIGYSDESQLTNRIRRKPFALILFDEIEKAHSAVFNIMLQIIDYGYLTDATGRSASFKNALIVMTSNVDQFSSDFTEVFSPEFLNRLDGIIPFSPLGKNTAGGKAEIEPAETSKPVEETGAVLTVDTRLRDEVVDQGFDAAHGARPLHRSMAQFLDDELASACVEQSPGVDADLDQEAVVLPTGSPRPTSDTDVRTGTHGKVALSTSKRLEEKAATLAMSPRFRDEVVDQRFDAAYGARPLHRTVAQFLDDELANAFGDQSLAEGEHVHVDVDRDREMAVSRTGSPRPTSGSGVQAWARAKAAHSKTGVHALIQLLTALEPQNRRT